MPPKAQGKKPGDDMDFSDLPTLPPANVFKFTVINKTFFSLENREKVAKRIQDNLVPSSADKIKMLTREEIVTSGKAKGTIADVATLAPEDPRRNVSEEDQVARAAADRLFEMTVMIRRAKKEKLAKLEEEAAAKATDDQPAQPVRADNDQVDGMIYLVDYPQTKAEAFALSRLSYSLNGVFEVNEVPKADAEDQQEEEEEEAGSDEDEEEADRGSRQSKKAADQEEVKQEATPDSEETQQAMQTIID